MNASDACKVLGIAFLLCGCVVLFSGGSPVTSALWCLSSSTMMFASSVFEE